jgi:epoxyqueuosine reductase
MDWMEARREQRARPQALWPEARSLIMVGMSYAPKEDPLRLAAEPGVGRISVYAQGSDYHDIVKKALKALARWLVDQAGGELKVFVDTAPVMEKPLAAAAGIGWQGKHSNLVSRDHGSWMFLGAIMTSLDLPPDPPHDDRCGSCDACQRACPTDAFPRPYVLDARRCVSYLTIEHKGPIPHELREGIGNRIYGCDDCLAVCPWNKFAQAGAANRSFAARAELAVPVLEDLLGLDDPSFRAVFAGSPIKRIGRNRMMRNALIAAGNDRGEGLVGPTALLLDDPAPEVRGAAIWALARIDPTRLEAEAGARRDYENDQQVLNEWDVAIAKASERG